MPDDPARLRERLIDERFRALSQELELIRDTIGVIRDLPANVAIALRDAESRLEKRVERNEQRIEQMPEAVARAVQDGDENVAGSVKELRADFASFVTGYQHDQKVEAEREEARARARRQNTITLVVAACAMVATLLAALISSHAFG